MPQRDIIVIGASAGGVDALIELIGKLPHDLPAAIFVVVHFPAYAFSALPSILTRAGKIPASHVMDGEKIREGHIYVAPPNYHILFDDNSILLYSGPREHGFRPAIDPLFRSAAHRYGERVVGVLLSGMLDDGVAGLLDIRKAGGLTIAQDPEEALFSSMPSTAIYIGAASLVLPVVEIADTILLAAAGLESQLAAKAQEDIPMTEAQEPELEDIQGGIQSFEEGMQTSENTVLTCPECGGVLWEMRDGKLVRYVCHTGHKYSEESFLEEQARTLESALWTALRALQEREFILRRMATLARERGSMALEKRYQDQAVEIERSAKVLHNYLMNGKDPNVNREVPDLPT